VDEEEEEDDETAVVETFAIVGLKN